MSNRNIRKVRHFKPAPSFKERAQAGVLKQTEELWDKYGWGQTEENLFVASPSSELPKLYDELTAVSQATEQHEHVHGEHCNHE